MNAFLKNQINFIKSKWQTEKCKKAKLIYWNILLCNMLQQQTTLRTFFNIEVPWMELQPITQNICTSLHYQIKNGLKNSFCRKKIYGQKLELIKALKVLNEGFTIGLHVNWLGFRVMVLWLGF